MDEELLIALMVLWLSTTVGMVSFLRMWFAQDGEAFHPHSVDVEHRHGNFLVVNSRTVCKYDCAVKSISEFIAPRGSSSSKQCTMLLVMMSVAGFLGSSRWQAVGDASPFQALLAHVGFSAILLVTTFELDVVPERFLEDKLIVTGWLIEKLPLRKPLPFRLEPSDERFRDFIRSSKEIYYLYEEDEHILSRSKDFHAWKYASFWPMLHMLGACCYVSCVPAAIVLNDIAEEKVGWITGTLFGIFCFLAYLTGNYLPVLSTLRGLVLMWNPFLREPHFMLKLKRAVENYHARNHTEDNARVSPTPKKKQKKDSGLRQRTTPGGAAESSKDDVRHALPNKQDLVRSIQSLRNDELDPQFLAESAEADKALDSVFLRFARSHPQLYLRIIGKVLVITELVAMMTPSVAMGLQWVTALCDGPPLLSIIDLVLIVVRCLQSGDCTVNPERLQHCIVKTYSGGS